MARGLVPYLQSAHASFSGALLLAFSVLGALGWRNRRDRTAGRQADFAAARRHRQLGPVLALLLPLGYVAGLGTVLVDHGIWLFYPLHLAVGTLLLIAVAATVLAARHIRGRVSPWRTPHFVLGLLTLALFFAQALLGLGALF